MARFTVGDELDNQDGNPAQQQHVDEAALVEDKFQNEPNDQQTRPGDPHFRSLPVRADGATKVLSRHKLQALNALGNSKVKKSRGTNFRARYVGKNLSRDCWKSIIHARTAKTLAHGASFNL